MEKTDYRSVAYDVWEELNRAFDFGGKPEIYVMGLVNEDEENINVKFYGPEKLDPEKVIMMHRKFFEEIPASEYLSLPDGKPVEYMLIVDDNGEENRPTMANGITQYEHKITHSRSLGSLENYHKVFRGLSEPFIGALGYFYMARQLGFRAEEKSTWDVGEPGYKTLEDNIKAGNAIAFMVHNSDMVRYKDIFHAPDQKHMWEIVGVIRPRIDLIVPKDMDKDFYYRSMHAAFEESGLEGEINIIERLP
jgi:hypothetical protein